MANRPQFEPEGPRNAKIMIVGEALGQQEELLGGPFKGKSGQELTAMLKDAGIARRDCYLTNVFWRRPPNNKLEDWCHSKKEANAEGLDLPALKKGKYIQRRWLEDVTEGDLDTLAALIDFPHGLTDVLKRLRFEIEMVRPNIIIALGNTPAWALLNQTSITKIRGTVADSTLVPGTKVLPTFHPSFILRVWQNRTIGLADLMKAKQESEQDSIDLPRREIHIEPTIEDLEAWADSLAKAKFLSYDIETRKSQITCIGFAPSTSLAYVVPFVNEEPPFSYWPDHATELRAWKLVRGILRNPNAKLAQNGSYDMQYLWRFMGMPPAGDLEDTMIQHHGLQPEMKKDLGFLGSIYTREQSWKLLRNRSDDTKRDD